MGLKQHARNRSRNNILQEMTDGRKHYVVLLSIRAYLPYLYRCSLQIDRKLPLEIPVWSINANSIFRSHKTRVYTTTKLIQD